MKFFLKQLAAVLLLAFSAALAFYLRPLVFNDATVRYRLWREGVHSESITVDGYRIHYFEANRDGKPLVLIHGLGDRSEAWAPLIAKFAAAGFHVYALDLVGYGRSSKPIDADYSIAFEETAVADWMHALGIVNADVVGWSMGGWVALRLGLDHPDLAQRLVLYDSAGIYWPPAWEPSLFDPQDGQQLNRLMAMLTSKPPNLPAFVARDVLRKFHAGWPVVSRGLVSMRNGHDLLDFRLGGLTQPTLLVWGAQDRLIPVDVGERMHRDILGSQLMLVPGCGHIAPSECSEAVLKGTLAFLGNH